jgi:hypothetical protein
MPDPMKTLVDKLTRIYAARPRGAGIPLGPENFSTALQDFAFSGVAERSDMTQFLTLAMTACDWAHLPTEVWQKRSGGGTGPRRVDKMNARKMALISILLFVQDVAKTQAYTSPHFPHLNVYRVLYQLTIRVVKPMRINQRDFGLCGPAHVLVVLAKTNPERYVKLALDLLLHGKCSLHGIEITPNKYVRAYRPEFTIPEADWLLAASFRNADEEIPAERGHYGDTKGPDVYRWLVACGYQQVALCGVHHAPSETILGIMPGLSHFSESYHPTKPREIEEAANIHSPMANITLAKKLCECGWRVLLLVNGSWANFAKDSATRKLAEDDLAMAKRSGELEQRRKEMDKDPTFLGLDEDTKRLLIENAVRGPQIVRPTQSGPKNTTGSNRVAMTEPDLRQSIIEKSQSYLGGFIVLPAVSHWVIAKRIEIADGKIKVVRYTWGAKEETDPFDISIFLMGYTGFCACRG